MFGKGSKYRTSYLSPRAKIYLKEYLKSRKDDNLALFVSDRAPYMRASKAAIERKIHIIGDKLGMRLYPHLFRHTSATDALRNGMDITQVQRILGHANLDTTMIYAKVCQDDVARSHARCVH